MSDVTTTNPTTNPVAATSAKPKKEKSALQQEVENFKPHAVGEGYEVTLGGKTFPLFLHARYSPKVGKSPEKRVQFYSPEISLAYVTALVAEAEIRKPNAGGQSLLDKLFLTLSEDATEYAEVKNPDGSVGTDIAKFVEYLSVGGLRKSGPSLSELKDEFNKINGAMVDVFSTPIDKLKELYGVENSEEGKALKMHNMLLRRQELEALIEAKAQAAAQREAKRKTKKAEATPAAPAAA